MLTFLFIVCLLCAAGIFWIAGFFYGRLISDNNLLPDIDYPRTIRGALTVGVVALGLLAFIHFYKF